MAIKRSCDTKEKLLETAIELVWKSNYDSVGVNEICDTAGVTKGSFYHYFESKAELFYAASDHYWNSIKGELDEMFSPQNSALTQLEKLLNFVIQKQLKYADAANPVIGCPFFSSAAQSGTDEQLVRRAALEMSEKSIVYSIALIRNLEAEGYLDDPIDPKVLGRLFSHYIQGVLLYGRVLMDLDVVKNDLREGLYRMLSLKHQYRSKPLA